MSEAAAVTDNTGQSRLEITADQALAQLMYRIRDGRLVLVHTSVPDEMSGHGVGGQLVRASIGKAAAEGLTLVPLCPFARDWLHHHPDDAKDVPIDWE